MRIVCRDSQDTSPGRQWITIHADIPTICGRGTGRVSDPVRRPEHVREVEEASPVIEVCARREVGSAAAGVHVAVVSDQFLSNSLLTDNE